MLHTLSVKGKIWINYTAGERRHCARLDMIEDAHARANDDFEVGPHPFADVLYVDLADAAHGYPAAEDLIANPAVSSWCDWIDEVNAEADARGHDETDEAMRFVGYVERDDVITLSREPGDQRRAEAC